MGQNFHGLDMGVNVLKVSARYLYQFSDHSLS
jgi:hypothetical protein